MNSIKLIWRCRVNNLKGNCKLFQFWKIQYFYSTSELHKKYNINEDETLVSKIIYNEILSKQKQPKVASKYTEPIFLKYLKEENHGLKDTREIDKVEEKEIVHFPYEEVKRFSEQNDECNTAVSPLLETIRNSTPSDDENIRVPQWSSAECNIKLKNLEIVKRWAYEDLTDLEVEEKLKFGTCNPHKPVSSMPCGGCGALLHCNDPSLPGFIPAEIFESKRKHKLAEELCQRCNFLKEYDIALGVNVSPSQYEKLISEIKEREALIIIMVDMLDFPCSIFPGIFELIGNNKSVVIVGNKVDLLIQDGPGFLEHYKEALMWCLKKQKIDLSKVIHVALISAKTGFGVENLITGLFYNWKAKGDVYLIGCTNVGKSSLFNTLIQSDYCKVKATHVLQRATVSAWPGTTLNLLKFPITKTKEWRLLARSERLKFQMQEEKALQKYQYLQKNIRLEQIPLQEYVGKTFLQNSELGSSENYDPSNDMKKRKGLNFNDPDLARCSWFYDTPGVIRKDQIINFLTTSELLLTVPKKMLFPRNFHLKPGYSLFIGGLARLDYISGADFVWFTVFASLELPITVTKLEDADYVYQKLLGSPLFRVPMGGKARMAKWPSLSSKKLEFSGNLSKFYQKQKIVKGNSFVKTADVDVVLSSAGWIAVNVPLAYRCNVEAWTPEGRGIYLRDVPIIKNGHTFKGGKIRGTPAYECIMKEVQGYSLDDKPEF